MADAMCLLLAMFGQLFIRGSQSSLLGVELDETGQQLLNEYLSLDEGKYLTELHEFRDAAIKIDLIDRKRKHRPVHQPPRILYQVGDSEGELPECLDRSEVCSKVDLYGSPWVERQCRCPDGRTCPSSLHGDDGHTIVDKTRQYKLCEPVKRLPICRYFKLGHHMDPSSRRGTGERDRPKSLLSLSAKQRALSGAKTSAQVSRGESRIYLCFRLFPAKQIALPTQGTLSTVHGTQETNLATRRSERIAPLPVSEGSSVSQTSHGPGLASGKILFWCLGD